MEFLDKQSIMYPAGDAVQRFLAFVRRKLREW